VTVVRGFEGIEKSATTGREGGQVSYIKGSIGDKPELGENLVFGSTSLKDDTFGLAEIILQCLAKGLDENLALTESKIITNS
jgi:hypothetical protein